MPRRSLGTRLLIATAVLVALLLVAHLGGGRLLHLLGRLHGGH